MRELKPRMPETQFVMVTVFEDSDHVFDALTAGAAGICSSRSRARGAARRRAPGARRRRADEQLHRPQGGAGTQTQRAKPQPGTENLSPRENEILRLLARGYAYKEIADELGVGLGTINTHNCRIYRKLQVSSRAKRCRSSRRFTEPRAPGGPKDWIRTSRGIANPGAIRSWVIS